MKRIALILTMGLLVACGAESPPFTPSANVGLSVGSNGVSTGASVGASNGTVSIGVGL